MMRLWSACETKFKKLTQCDKDGFIELTNFYSRLIIVLYVAVRIQELDAPVTFVTLMLQLAFK